MPRIVSPAVVIDADAACPGSYAKPAMRRFSFGSEPGTSTGRSW
jgi:hypothetical protein